MPVSLVLGTVTGLGAGLLLFFAALIVAGILMAHGETGHRSAVEIASRISGPENGPQIAELCTATIRAVAQGVVGIAFIQMLLIGIGFVVMGIPGAGLLALAVLLLGIMQLPATLITIPVIVFVIATQGVSAMTIIFSVYVFVAGLADNVLKPLLLGRGVAVPMPVVLIGALGGMVTGGIIGLFIGPVLLSVGYQLFWRWVKDQAKPERLKEEQQKTRLMQPGPIRVPGGTLRAPILAAAGTGACRMHERLHACGPRLSSAARELGGTLEQRIDRAGHTAGNPA